MKLALQDARTKEVREIEPERIGAAKWGDYEGRRLIHVQLKAGTSVEEIPLDNPPSNFVEQLMVVVPGAEGISAFSGDPATGLIRRGMSALAFGASWSDARIEAVLKLLLEEVRQLRAAQMKGIVRTASLPPKVTA